MSSEITIVVRTGKGWPLANGISDPPGRYYLRHYRGNRRYRYQGSWDTYRQALAEKLRTEQAIILAPLMQPCEQALNAFVAHLKNPLTKNKKDDRSYRPKGISERAADIRELIAFVKKFRVAEIKREDVLHWRDSLQLHPSTIRGKLSSVSGWHKWLGGDGLVQNGDLPRKRKTRPKPYSPAEIEAHFKVAEGQDHLLLRVALAAGLRKMEMATLERSDLHGSAPIITIQESKPRFNWVPKTIQGARDVTIDQELWQDLLQLPEGLLFPLRRAE